MQLSYLKREWHREWNSWYFWFDFFFHFLCFFWKKFDWDHRRYRWNVSWNARNIDASSIARFFFHLFLVLLLPLNMIEMDEQLKLIPPIGNDEQNAIIKCHCRTAAGNHAKEEKRKGWMLPMTSSASISRNWLIVVPRRKERRRHQHTKWLCLSRGRFYNPKPQGVNEKKRVCPGVTFSI